MSRRLSGGVIIYINLTVLLVAAYDLRHSCSRQQILTGDNQITVIGDNRAPLAGTDQSRLVGNNCSR